MQKKKSQQSIDLSVLPINAQQEVYDFFLFLQQKYPLSDDASHKETNSLNVEDIFPRMVKDFTPLNRAEVYDR